MNPRGERPSAPGWYPDPDGAPGMVRWWTGTGWSGVMTPAGPGVVVRTPPSPPSADRPTGAAEARAARSPRALWTAGGAVLAIVAVLLVALVTSGSGSRTPDADPAPRTTVPAGPTFADGPARIIDRSAGISYPVLGGWLQYSQAGQAETTTITGQYFTVQEPIPDGGQYVAQCTSGPVAARFGWRGAATLQRTMTALARSVREHDYPTPNRLQVLGDQARTVDGHPARLYEFDLAWHIPGYEATGERAALLLIDVGRPAPALLYVAIPDTHARLYPDIDRVLADVRVL